MLNGQDTKVKEEEVEEVDESKAALGRGLDYFQVSRSFPLADYLGLT